MMKEKLGSISTTGNDVWHLILQLIILVNLMNEISAQLTEVFQEKEYSQTNLYANITIDRSFWVSSGAVFKGKLFDTSQLKKIEMFITVTSTFSPRQSPFPLVSLKQSVEITNREKDVPSLSVQIWARLLQNRTNVNSMNISIVSNVHPGLNILNSRGFPSNFNHQLAWVYSGMKNFTVGYNASPVGTSKSIHETIYNITDYKRKLLDEFYDPVTSYFCLNRIKITEQEFLHGYNVLICAIGFIFAFLLIVLLKLLTLIFKDNAVSSSSNNKIEYYNELVFLSPIVYTNGYYTSKTEQKTDTSIVTVLAMDRTRIDREIINRDLSRTERLENEKERLWCDGSSEITLSLIRNLERSRQITSEVAQSIYAFFKSERAKMEVDLDAHFKEKLRQVKDTSGVEDQDKIRKMKEESEKIIAEAERNNYRPETITMLQEEENAKIQNQITKMQLNEREQLASLNKDFSSQRRMMYRNLEKKILQMIRENSDLDQERQEWFMRENEKKKNELANEIEKNIRREQMALEEKLAKQQALAEQTDSQDLDHGELLDRIANQQISLLKKFKKEKVIPEEEAKTFIEDVVKKLKGVKKKYDDQKEKETKELDQKLSREKNAKLNEIRTKHKNELDVFEKNHQNNLQEGKVDISNYLNEQQKILSDQNIALLEAESELDIKHAHQFQDVRDKLMNETKKELEKSQDELIQYMKAQGANDEAIDNLIQIHKQALKLLEEEQLENKKNQNNLLHEKLSRLKEKRMKKAEEEKDDKNKIQKYEKSLVKELLNSQLTMSQSNRDKILEEHEKQMIKFENSMTLNKIRQQQILEQKLAKKRQEKMKRLMEKQESEKSNQRRPSEASVEGIDDRKLIERHVKERLSVMQETIDRSTALEEIENTLNKERAEALRRQEEEMGVLVAKMKLDKIKESCEIEEKERAIFRLNASIIDELHTNGFVEDSQCSTMIDEHNQHRKAYRQQQEEEIKKQQELLQENLQKKMLKRQETMVEKHKEEIKKVLDNSRDGVSSKLKKLVLKNKQLMEKEKLRNDLTREMNQLLEETRQNYELEIKKRLQEKEFQLITKLIKLGKLKRSEIANVMRMLLPKKSTDEINELLSKIIGEGKEDLNGSQISFRSSFELRIREALLDKDNEINRHSDQGRVKGKKKKSRMNEAYITDLAEETAVESEEKSECNVTPYKRQPFKSNFQDDYHSNLDSSDEEMQNRFSERAEASAWNSHIDPDMQLKRNKMILPPVRLSPLEKGTDTPKRKKRENR